jgi:hypothetical protein
LSRKNRSKYRIQDARPIKDTVLRLAVGYIPAILWLRAYPNNLVVMRLSEKPDAQWNAAETHETPWKTAFGRLFLPPRIFRLYFT